MGALASSQRSGWTGEKACGTWRSHGSNFNEALDEVRNLLQRDGESRSQRTARKPVLCRTCRVSSVTAERRWENCA